MHTDSSPTNPETVPAPPVSTARLIARRATDLLAISVVLICGLSAGQQIIAWWRADAVGPILSYGSTDPQVDWSGRPLELQFGESSLGMQRIPFTGTRDAAEQQLIRLARTALIEAKDTLPPPSADESAWMTSLEKLTPEESQPDLGAIYLVPGFLPSVAAIRKPTASELSTSTSRLIAWGLATPRGDNAWTLMMFQNPDARPAVTGGDVRLPTGAETLLAWQDQAGNRVISFRGAGRMDSWLKDFDRQFGAEANLRRLVEDTRAAGRWQTAQGEIDVQLTRNPEEITGLLWITARVRRHNGETDQRP